MLFALTIVAGLVPASFAHNNQDSNNAQFNELKDSKTQIKVDKVVKVDAAYKYKKYKKYKKSSKYYSKYRYNKYKKYKKYSYKKKSTRYAYSSIGDCWAMSNYLHKKFTKAGVKSRIIQYKTSMSPRHRSVQIYKSGKWVDYNYKANGYNKIYNATSSKPGMHVIATAKV